MRRPASAAAAAAAATTFTSVASSLVDGLTDTLSLGLDTIRMTDGEPMDVNPNFDRRLTINLADLLTPADAAMRTPQEAVHTQTDVPPCC